MSQETDKIFFSILLDQQQNTGLCGTWGWFIVLFQWIVSTKDFTSNEAMESFPTIVWTNIPNFHCPNQLLSQDSSYQFLAYTVFVNTKNIHMKKQVGEVMWKSIWNLEYIDVIGQIEIVKPTTPNPGKWNRLF